MTLVGRLSGSFGVWSLLRVHGNRFDLPVI
jgi:hypothetical protein